MSHCVKARNAYEIERVGRKAEGRLTVNLAMNDQAVTIARELWSEGPDTVELGSLRVTSGAVVVCDAGVLDDGVDVDVPNGEYLVRIAKNEHGEITASSLLARGASPVSFEEVGDYGVDAGLSGFFDKALHERASTFDFPSDIYNDLIDGVLYPKDAPETSMTMVPFEGGTFSACRSGGGDGVYPVFVGRDAKGEIVAVITTF